MTALRPIGAFRSRGRPPCGFSRHKRLGTLRGSHCVGSPAMCPLGCWRRSAVLQALRTSDRANQRRRCEALPQRPALFHARSRTASSQSWRSLSLGTSCSIAQSSRAATTSARAPQREPARIAQARDAPCRSDGLRSVGAPSGRLRTMEARTRPREACGFYSIFCALADVI